MAVFVAAPLAWNWLPTELTLLWSTTTFCCYLNTFLFFFCSSLFMDTGTDDCFVMCPWSPRRRSNINNPVTVPVNKLMCVWMPVVGLLSPVSASPSTLFTQTSGVSTVDSFIQRLNSSRTHELQQQLKDAQDDSHR